MGFCERLEALLKEKNIMQKDFLAACGLGKNSFSNWRKSKTGYPTLPVLRSISEYLGVSVEYLKGETDDRAQKNSPGQMTEAEVDAELVKIWEDANEEDRKLLLDMARMVRDRRNGNAK